MKKPIHRILFALAVLAAAASACTELEDPGTEATPQPLATPVVVDEWIQPSCVPNDADDDGTSDDGERCDGTATSDFCDIVPNPYFYCVTCTLSGSACYPNDP